jgi:hypothetical protein
LDTFVYRCAAQRIDRTIGPAYFVIARLLRGGQIITIDRDMLSADANDFRKAQRCKNAISLIEDLIRASESDAEAFSDVAHWVGLLRDADTLPFPVSIAACQMFAVIVGGCSNLGNVADLLVAGVAALFANVIASCDDPAIVENVLVALGMFNSKLSVVDHRRAVVLRFCDSFPTEMFCDLLGMTVREAFGVIFEQHRIPEVHVM